MSIETRKIEFIQEFLKLQTDEAISRLEKTLSQEKSLSDKKGVVPMSVQEFNKRIDKSIEDSKNGRLTDVDDLLAEIEEWN